mgnify:FL=1
MRLIRLTTDRVNLATYVDDAQVTNGSLYVKLVVPEGVQVDIVRTRTDHSRKRVTPTIDTYSDADTLEPGEGSG